MPKQTRPPQTQPERPGHETQMDPKPVSGKDTYRGSGKLEGKTAIVTGGDSGIGRAVAIAFAKEGARVAVVYLNEHDDAQETKRLIEESGGKCLLLSGDIGQEKFCAEIVDRTVAELGGLDVLVNNAGEQHPQEDISAITEEQLERTFRTNIFSMFFLCKAAVPRFTDGGVVINTTSVTAYRGSPNLLDYSSTKGAIVAFTRSFAKNVAPKIRVNAVAPGPIWTPLITSTFPEEKVKSFGADTPLQRPGEPAEVAPAFVFLASNDSSYMTGQVLHVNGGEIVNG